MVVYSKVFPFEMKDFDDKNNKDIFARGGGAIRSCKAHLCDVLI